ncbi:MAG: hypothetical protein HND47_20185 [Chloroflexi bacterium]|nr:hypothetical protein [Chloroflexota bacterium]
MRPALRTAASPPQPRPCSTPRLGAVNNAAGGRVIYAIALNQGSANGQVDLATSTAWTFTELFDGFEGNGGNRTCVGESATTSAGSAVVSVGATVAHNRSALVAFALNPSNTPPTIQTPIADVNVNEDAANTVFNLHNNFQDAESADAALTYTVQANTNPGLFTSVDISNPTAFTLDYAPDANGTSNITIRATDPGGLFVEDTFTVTVAAVNDAPAFTAGPNQTVNEDAGAQTVAGWATGISAGPADESAQTLTFNVSNDNNALFSVQPAVATNGTLSYTPAPNANGSAIVTLSLSDNGGTANGGVDTSAPQTFTITVNPVDDLPVAVDDNATVNEDDPATIIDVLANDTDIDGGADAGRCGGSRLQRDC